MPNRSYVIDPQGRVIDAETAAREGYTPQVVRQLERLDEASLTKVEHVKVRVPASSKNAPPTTK